MAIKRAIVTTLFTLVANKKPGGGGNAQGILSPHAGFSGA
jgi:predicted class III extradiol MEMO1 family dioxygenase